MGFEIQLPLFKGPFDLLLFFIERDELDINDIPISKITNDFLDYLHKLEEMNVEVASEFILVASSLMRIKAKMLVPRPEVDEEGNELDPREELVQKLIEYKKYKSVIAELSDWESNRLDKSSRGNVLKELQTLSSKQDVEAEMQDLDMYKLLRVYEKIMRKFDLEQAKPVHKIVPYPYTITEQKQYLVDKVNQKGELSFEALIKDNPDKIAVIFNFLSILELLNLGMLAIRIGLGYNNFWLCKIEQGNEA